jgi:hypothetical protein
MLTGISLSAPTLSAAWEAGLNLFTSPSRLYRHDSERGVAFEIPGLTLVVDSIEDDTPPARYLYPALIEDYAERMFGSQRATSRVHQRLRDWASPAGGSVDQIADVTELLRESPETRTATFSLWQPGQDLHADYPVSPVAGQFRVISEKVHLYLVARSVDYWVGAVPELLAFARLQRSVAGELNRSSGSLVFHMWSAHIYEDDFLAHLMNGGSA